MAFDAAALRAVELTSYSAAELVNLLATTHLRADFDAVSRVLTARESRAAQAEAQLRADLADALQKVQAHDEDLRRASLAEGDDSARLRIAEEEARSVVKAAVSKIQEVWKKKQDEASAHFDAVMDEIHALRKKLREDLSSSMATIVDETEARIKAAFAKIHAPLKKPERDGVVPRQEAPDGMALALVSPSIEVPQQSMQRVVEMVTVDKVVQAAADGSGGNSLKRKADVVVTPDDTALVLAIPSNEVPHQINKQRVVMIDKGVQAAADGSGCNSLKRKADAVEHGAVSPVQIPEAVKETSVYIAVPPGFSPAQFKSSSEEAGPSSHSSLSQAMKDSAKVSEGEVSVDAGSGKQMTKEPTPLEETGEGCEYNAPSEATHDQRAEEPAYLEGPCLHSSLAQAIEDSAKVSKGEASVKGSGKEVTIQEVEKTREGSNVMRDQGAKEPAHLEGASAVPVQQVERFEGATLSKRGRWQQPAVPKQKEKSGPSLGSGRGRGRSNTSASPVLALGVGVGMGSGRGAYSFKRPSPLCRARPRNVQKSSPRTEDGTQERNIASRHTFAGTRGLVLPSSHPVSRTFSMPSSKVTENLGKCVENKADSVPVNDDDTKGTSHEEGNVGRSSNGRGGTQHHRRGLAARLSSSQSLAASIITAITSTTP